MYCCIYIVRLRIAFLRELLLLKVIRKQDVIVNGEARTLYYSLPNHKLIALFIMASELGYQGAY